MIINCVLPVAPHHLDDMRVQIFRRRLAGKAFHTSVASTSEPKGCRTLWKQASMAWFSFCEVLRHPTRRPRFFFLRQNRRTTD